MSFFLPAACLIEEFVQSVRGITCLVALCNPADEFAACHVMSNLYRITLGEEPSQRCILSSRPPSEEAQIKYTFSPNKIGHAVSAPIKRREKKITVNCRAAVYGEANDD